MNKKILTTVATVMILSIVGSTSIVSAKEREQYIERSSIEDQEITYNIDYKDPNYNWDEISHIEVVYINGNDDFIKTAIEKGVEVSFQPKSLGYIGQSRLKHFSSIGWITRNGVISLSLNPIHPFTIDKSGGWGEAVGFFQYHTIYREINNPSKYNSLLNQFDCHVDFAKGFKTPWNLEPATPDKGYAGFVASKCN